MTEMIGGLIIVFILCCVVGMAVGYIVGYMTGNYGMNGIKQNYLRSKKYYDVAKKEYKTMIASYKRDNPYLS